MMSFICKFISSMMRDCKKEICLVLLGMVLCLCLLINFAQNLFSFKSGYYALSDEDSVKFNHNIICFAFSDVSRLDEIARKVSEMPDVYGVYLYGSVRAGGIQCGTRLPLMEENRLLTGEIPEELSEGEIITSYAFSSGIKRDAQSNPDEEFTVKEDEGNDFSREYIGSGETVCLDGKNFVNIAEISDPDGHIVTVNDFMELYRESGQSEVTLMYIYDDGFTQEQKQAVEDVITAVKKPDRMWVGAAAQGIEFSSFIESARDVLLGLVIASLNALFLYAYLLNKRIPVYTILKLQGLTNRMLRGMLLMEFFLVYLLACMASAIVYSVYSVAGGKILEYTGQIYLYSFGSLMVPNLLLFLVITRKLVKRPVFELYQRR